MPKHSLLFKEQRLTTLSKGIEHRDYLPHVLDVVCLETITGKKLLASVSMSNTKNRVLDCCVLGTKPDYIPDNLDCISFDQVCRVYAQGKGVKPRTDRTVSKLAQLIEVITALLGNASFRNASGDEMLSIVRVVCEGCESSLEYVAPELEHTSDISSEFLLNLLQRLVDGHQEENIVK